MPLVQVGSESPLQAASAAFDLPDTALSLPRAYGGAAAGEPLLSLSAVRLSLLEQTKRRDAHAQWQVSSFVEAERLHRVRVLIVAEHEAEQMHRTAIGVEEAIAVTEIEDLRRRESLVPWCSNSCSYCCMSRYHWEGHVLSVFAGLRLHVAELETRSRSDISFAWMKAFDSFSEEMRASRATILFCDMQRSALSSDEAHCRNALMLEVAAQALSVTTRHQEIVLLHRIEDARLELRNKNLAQLQQLEKVEAIEQRVWRQIFYGVGEQEKSLRSTIAGIEHAKRKDLRARLCVAKSALDVAQWHEEVKDIFAECDGLRQQKQQREAADAEQAAAAAAAVLKDLDDELKEMKKMKKAGPPKTPMFMPCGRCGQVPAKDFYVHRLEECPQRPTQCPKCQTIFPLSQQEAHRSACPARVVPCPTCANHYKAGYFDATHQQQCQAIAEAATTLSTVRPRLPIRVAAGGPSGPGGIAVTFEVPVEGIPAGTHVALLTINNSTITSASDIESAAAGQVIGGTVAATVALSRQLHLLLFSPGPLSGPSVLGTEPRVSPRLSLAPGDIRPAARSPRRSLVPSKADDGGDVVVAVQVPVKATLQDHVFSALRELVTADQSQYCKPQIESKKRPSTAPTKK
jgi:hypothetical protein